MESISCSQCNGLTFRVLMKVLENDVHYACIVCDKCGALVEWLFHFIPESEQPPETSGEMSTN